MFDRFFANAEVSSQGHIWSTAAYVTNYGEKIVPSGYAGKHADMDGEESDEPERGFLWTLAKREGVSFRDYGEMVKGNPGWPVTQRDLGANVNPDYVPMDFVTPDQKRADVWISELQRYVRDSNMPQLEVMWLPMDHLAAGRPGKCTPRACMADNDLALGRIRCAEIQTLRQMCCCSILRILFIQVLRGDAQSHAALHALQSSK